MAKKQVDAEEEELLEIMEASGGLTIFYPDWEKGTLNFKFSGGREGSISFAQLSELREQSVNPCLLCFGKLGPDFDKKLTPVICLRCDQCRATYKIVEGQLCLFAD